MAQFALFKFVRERLYIPCMAFPNNETGVRYFRNLVAGSYQSMPIRLAIPSSWLP